MSSESTALAHESLSESKAPLRYIIKMADCKLTMGTTNNDYLPMTNLRCHRVQSESQFGYGAVGIEKTETRIRGSLTYSWKIRDGEAIAHMQIKRVHPRGLYCHVFHG